MKYIVLVTYLLIYTLFSQDGKSTLNNYPIGTDQFVQFKLSSVLNEISGITITEDERMFAHNDERGAIYEIDYNTGVITKIFYLGTFTVNRDFEDIAYADGVFYLITSTGIMYKFEEGKDGEDVDYEIIDLKISDKFEIEGLCYDKVNNSLLIASKEYPGKKYDNTRTIYEYDLAKSELYKKPKFIISLKKLKNKFDIKDFYPSAISIHPVDDTILLISAKGNPCIVELSREGNLINAKRLDDKVHRQPEGIAFLKDGVMLIADEASGKKPTITKYFPLSYN